jgi:voltage-gated potassium channel
MNSVPKKLLHIAMAISAVVMIGTVGFKVIGGERTSFLDALYMTAITISTVGYGDVIGLDDKPFGKIFAIIFVFLGTGTVAYLVTLLAAYIIEGELKRVFRRRKMDKRIEKMKDHYIVCGIGMVGLYIAHELYQMKRHLVAIDSNEGRLDDLKAQNIDIDMVVGDATENDILEKAMVESARGLFATTNSDNDNIVIVLTAKQLNPALKIISRCTDTKNMDKLKRAGADTVVALNYIGGMRMASEMIRPHVTSFLDKMLSDRDSLLRVEEVHIRKQSPFVGKAVKEMNLESMGNILLIAARNADGGWVYNPKPAMAIEGGMSFIILATPEEKEILQAFLSAEPGQDRP